MDKNFVKNRIEKLKKEIAFHRYQYHVRDLESMSQEALDSLKNELFKLEQEFPDLVTSDSPTQRVGGRPLDKFKKAAHSSRMLSLFDAFNKQDMADWEARNIKILFPRPPLLIRRGGGAQRRGGGVDLGGYFCELKLDGIAIALRYENNSLVQAITRGDGRIGEDVTGNIKTIDSVPLNLADKIKNIEVRGEIIMTKAVFKELNQKYKKANKPELKNPRNAAAGSVRQLDPKLAAERKLDFIAYEIVADMGLKKNEEKRELLARLGFKTLRENKYCANLEAVNKMHAHWEKNRDNLPFEVDGMVVKVNDLALWNILGTVGKGPRYMMAYKFAGIQVTTRIKEVVWQVGRTGVLTPIAVLEPANVGGVTVTHATLHNMDEIKRLKLKIGDTVILERAGDVIPKVIKALPKLRTGKEKTIIAPKKCLICASDIKKIKGEVAHRCINNDCYAVNLRRLSHWTSKGAVDIEGLGPKIIEQLMKEGLISDVADFYSLAAGDLKPLERFADKSAENLVDSIQVKKNILLERFLIGLGIRHIGEESALFLAAESRRQTADGRQENKISQIKRIFSDYTIEELENLPDIGPIVARSVYDWFHNKLNIELLNKLEKAGVVIDIAHLKTRKRPSELSGKAVVLTGSLKSLTRERAKAKIRELGGKISSAVSPKTDLIVAGKDPGSKFEKAKELGVKIISEEEFLKMIK
ncbi:NAD-dependent DNA ligase LigA [Candidatus Parcubacteria bacterium]|nr:NAD-dependent DNA ligase LigA [Candidatus Parcubacteria bacterium]